MKLKRPKVSQKRIHVGGQVNQDVKMMLDMLGFDIPKLIEHTLENVAGHKRCPCCGREVKPLITGRKI